MSSQFPYLFAAYTIVWLGVLWYTFSLGQHHKRLAEQVEALEAAVRAQQGTGGARSEAGRA